MRKTEPRSAGVADFLKDPFYEPVEDRLRAFWSEFPDGRIDTELIEQQAGIFFIVKASVWSHRGEPYPVATGLAQESVTDRGVNSTSALENCETSAIGRALANLGYAARVGVHHEKRCNQDVPAVNEPATERGGAVPRVRPNKLLGARRHPG
jgi:hypothetical protein